MKVFLHVVVVLYFLLIDNLHRNLQQTTTVIRKYIKSTQIVKCIEKSFF